MKVLGIRFCNVTPEAAALTECFEKLGLTRSAVDGGALKQDEALSGGAIFPTEEGNSWIEIWEASTELPRGVMLQIIVDDADAFAANAKENDLEVHGPIDEHGERIYFLKAPSGLAVSFQSCLKA